METVHFLVSSVSGEKEDFHLSSQSLVGSRILKVDVRLINRRKIFKFVCMGAPKECETQRGVRQLRLLCHPELRNGRGNWGSEGRRVIYRKIRW